MGWGWLKTVGKIGAGIAAPFTGGASLAAIPAIDGISKGLAAGSQASASNRGTKAELMLDHNRQLEEQLLAREQEKRAAQAQAYKSAMMGDYASSWKPMARPAGIPGTYNAPSDASKGVGSKLYEQAMMRLHAPDLNTQAGQSGMPVYNNLMNSKDFKKTMNPSIWEKIMGIGSVAAPILGGAFGKNTGEK